MAKITGRSVADVALWQDHLKRPPVPEYCTNGQMKPSPWSAAEDEVVMVTAAVGAAKLLARSRRAVYHRRATLHRDSGGSQRCTIQIVH